MAEPTVKIINLTKVVDGKTNRITVTDTDNDYKNTVNSVMGFDKNDKVTVKGDISVFTQDEINQAFFSGYQAEDGRKDEDVKDVTKTDLQIKDGKISGDTSKAFRMEDLAKVAGVTKPVSTTVSNTNGPTQPILGQNPFVGPEMAFTMANLTNQVSNFLGFPMSSNFGQPIFSNMNIYSAQNLARSVFNAVLSKMPNQTNKSGTNQNPATNNTAVNNTNNTPAANTTTTNTTNSPAANEVKAVVSEGEIKDETVKKETPKTTEEKKADEAKTAAKAKAKAKAEKEKKEKAAIKYDGKNSYGQDLRKYTDKNGNRIIEKYRDGKLQERDTYHIENVTIGSTSFKADKGMTVETFYTNDKVLAKPQFFDKSKAIPTYGN